MTERRWDDIVLTVSDCSDCLNVSHGFVMAAIHAKDLVASCSRSPAGRPTYRVVATDFVTYVKAKWDAVMLARTARFLRNYRTATLRRSDQVRRRRLSSIQ